MAAKALTRTTAAHGSATSMVGCSRHQTIQIPTHPTRSAFTSWKVWPRPVPPSEHFIFCSVAFVIRTADTVSEPSACCLPQWMSLVRLTLFYITSSDFLRLSWRATSLTFSEWAILSLLHPTDITLSKKNGSGVLWVGPDFWPSQSRAAFNSVLLAG